ncbi:MAG: UxaA family hydrolase, partial [bacterium]|nr:UxaA family hydrolase [bacterium]
MTQIERVRDESIHDVDPRDHVATALRDIIAGERLDLHGRTILARADIPQGHKIAVSDIRLGDDVLKYGWPIGRAT